ncbi:MAG TPA: phosphatidate cytidylyltransferase [Rubricoccaceae bacterium]|nr:phosphatidate cytidylyltransferase [Rubricoccaceae bacterium]
MSTPRAAERPVSNLVQRVLTALVALPIAVGGLWLGGWPFAALVAGVSVVAQAELYGLMRKAGVRPLVVLGLPLGVLAALHVFLPWVRPVLLVGGIAVFLAAMFRQTDTPIQDVSGTLFGVFYPPALLGTAVALREAHGPGLDAGDGFYLTLAVLAAVWGADTVAYFIGRAVGRHPLFPRISPKKTWEGAAGGLLGAVAVAAAFKLTALPPLSWLDVGVIALCAAGAGLLGDLAESGFKRSVGAKDSAAWLPGHGGLLDRLDAAAVALPLATLYLDHVAGLF